MVNIFGTGGNELFVLEWPARPLDATTYAYDVSSVYSGLMKPQPVLEAEFLTGHSDFIVDRACERFLLTFNPGGYLRRVAPTAGAA